MTHSLFELLFASTQNSLARLQAHSKATAKLSRFSWRTPERKKASANRIFASP